MDFEWTVSVARNYGWLATKATREAIIADLCCTAIRANRATRLSEQIRL